MEKEKKMPRKRAVQFVTKLTKKKMIEHSALSFILRPLAAGRGFRPQRGQSLLAVGVEQDGLQNRLILVNRVKGGLLQEGKGVKPYCYKNVVFYFLKTKNITI